MEEAQQSAPLTHTLPQFWDERFGEKTYRYGTDPNAFFAEELALLPTGSILLPAEGEGRNAVWAAQTGWQVSAFDFSTGARKKAMALAKEYGVQLNYAISTPDDYRVQDLVDAVAVIFMHLPAKEQARFFRKCASWLKPEGTLLVEVFSTKQLSNSSGGPKDPTFLYTPEILASHLAPYFEVTLLEEVETELNEGPDHQGKASVVRAVAKKREKWLAGGGE